MTSRFDPRRDFRVRLVLSIGLLAIAFALLGTQFNRKTFIDQIKADRGMLLAQIAHQMAGEMDKGIYERLREIQIVASLQQLSDPQTPLDEKRALLEKLKNSYRNYAWIGLTDAEGNILVGTHHLLEGKSVAERKWFIEGAKGPAVGDVHDAFLLAKLLPKPENDFLPLRLLDVSAPIRDKHGKLLGVLCGHLSWDWSYQVRKNLLTPFENHTSADILIIGKDGQVLLGTAELHKLAAQLSLPSMAAARTGGNSFLTETWPDGRAYLTGYTASRGHGDFQGLGWTVLVRQPVDQAFARADALQRNEIIITLLSVLAFGMVLWLMTGRLTEPMRRIATAARRIQNGEEDVRIPIVPGNDEIALLSQSLGEMVQTQERQNAELTAKNQQLQLSAQVFSSNTEGIMIVDADERIQSVNEAFSKITGFGVEEVIGQTPRVLRSGRHDKAFYAAMWSEVERHGRWQGEIWNRRKSGETYPQSLIISQVRNSAGIVTHYIGIFSDITERKESEQRLRKLAQAVEQSPQSILIVDLGGNIEYVNDAFVKISGYDRSELIGKNPRMLQSGKTPRATYDALWEEITHGRSWQGEFFNRRKNGTDYVEMAVISPIVQADGHISHYVGVKEDITERRRDAEELGQYRNHLEELVTSRTRELEAAKAAAEAANASKSAFLANMSHEIRSPLNAITGMAYLIRRVGLTPQQMDWMAKLEAAGEHLLGTINAILDLSKIEAGKADLQDAEFRLDDVIGNVTSIIRERADAKHLTLHTEMEPMPPGLRGDQTRLQQALLNYADNAVKFTESGKITLRTKLLEDASESVLIRFEVQDSGIGIAPEVTGKLFSAFEQGDNTLTRRYGGTGLGLAITKKFAQLMGGEAGAESAPGAGSTFWFTARLRKGDAVEVPGEAVSGEAAEAILKRDGQGIRILLAEDEPINREIATAILAEVGLVVDVAMDGAEALRLAGENDYAAILMDMQMPNMDGIEATRRIRRIPKYSQTPIIAMTANAYAEDKASCLEAGMNDFIAKPVVIEDLYKALVTWLKTGA